MNTNLLNWLILAACLGPSFLLSGMEAGVFALNRLRVRRLARGGSPSARLLHGFLENPERFLWTIVVGNTLSNFLILGWLVIELQQLFLRHPPGAIAIFAAAVFLFYSFFDLLPKMLFRAWPNQLCLSAANLFRPIHVVLGPLVLIVEDLSRIVLRWTGGRAQTGRLFGNREEMLAVMQESAQVLTTDERAMVNRVLGLQNITVRQVATPLAQTVTIQTDLPLAGALALARERKLSRLPVWEMRDGRPCIAGLLALGPLLYRDDLDPQKPAAAHMRPALFLAEDTRLEVALRRMQRAGERLAIVLARDGRETGVVSLEDILKLMFGEVKL
jgi:CBS domain containing-hemolysin-like protein